MRTLNVEQLVIIADQFCRHRSARIRSFAALAAAAAVPGARLHGISIHTSPSEAAHELRVTIAALSPLSSDNEAFADVCSQVYRRWCDEEEPIL